MMFSFFDAVDWGNARLQDAINFLRSTPSSVAPKPSPQFIPYTPAFTGGQCDAPYKLEGYLSRNSSAFGDEKLGFFNSSTPSPVPLNANFGALIIGDGFGGAKFIPNGVGGGQVAFYNKAGILQFTHGDISGSLLSPMIFTVVKLGRLDSLPDNCGNLPNPNPDPNIKDDGLFQPNNPVIGDENGTVNPAAIILSPAAPLILIGGGLAAAAAAAAAAQAATDALAAIKKVAESLDALKKLWEKLQEFLEEWEKDRPKNRDIVRQTYGSIDGDGAIDFYPLSNKNFTGIQVDIVVTEVPLGFGKYFGSMSPSRYRYKELGYISFYSINKGIIETHSIQFKRSSLAIPKTAVGFIYHFGLDNKIKGFAFGTFSVRKS